MSINSNILDSLSKLSDAKRKLANNLGNLGIKDYTAASPLLDLVDRTMLQCITPSTETTAIQQINDPSYASGIKIKTKNYDAYELDNSLTDTEPVGASGAYSMSIGGNTQAKGKRAFSSGTGTLAKGNYSHSEGSDSVALGSASHVEGYKNTTGPNADSAHAEGGENVVTSNRGHAEGYHNTVSGTDAHAEGGNNTASGEQSHAEGLENISSGNYSHAEGQQTRAQGIHSHSEGTYTKAIGNISHTEGNKNEVHSVAAHAEGAGNQIIKEVPSTNQTDNSGSSIIVDEDPDFNIDEHRGDNSHIEGARNLLYGYSAHAEGSMNTVKEHYAHAEGYGNISGGNFAHVEGNGNYVGGGFAFKLVSWDLPNKAFTLDSIEGVTVDQYVVFSTGHIFEKLTNKITAVNTETKTITLKAIPDNMRDSSFENKDVYIYIINIGTGGGSYVPGYKTTRTLGTTRLKGDFSHVEGYKNTAYSQCGHVEGYNNMIFSDFSHAEGYNNNIQINTDASHAEGAANTIYASFAHAEGFYHVIREDGTHGHAEGAWCEVSAPQGHAEGWNNFARGMNSHVGGRWNIAGYPEQTVIGRFNKNKENTLFEVGNGKSSTESDRSNSFEVYADGHAEVQTQGTTDNSVINKKYVDTSFQEKLISGTNIKTINNQSLLGSGNIDISGGGGTITVDAELSETSTNPVQNKIITEALNNKQNKITLSDTVAIDQVSVNSVIVRGIDGAGFISRGNGTIKVSDGDLTTPIEVTNLKDGTSDSSAINKKQLDTKQDKFATLDSSSKKISLDPTKYDTIGNEGSSITFSSYTTLHATTDVILDAAGGDVVINGDSPSVRSSKYKVSWNSTNEAIEITFHE